MAQPTSHNRRRDKPILSCTFCRERKLRCDRQSPCRGCARRGKPGECIYTCSEEERKNTIDYRPHARGQQARQRIARLENLVTEMRDMMQSSHHASDGMASSNETPNDPGPPLAPAIVDDMGKLSLTENHAVYTGSSHWVTILEDVSSCSICPWRVPLSEEFSKSTTSLESTPADAGLTRGSPATRISLLNSAPCLPREQILAMIPARKVVDRHISHFFNTFDLAPFILHRNKFLAEYATFWANPSVVPIMWVGLLFSMMSMSALLQQQDIGALGLSTVEPHDMLETYRTLTIHCLLAGDYLRPSRYTVETLTLHFAVDQHVNLDTCISSWILIEVVIRIALRVGLHRDPSHWPEIRPVQAELRRRLWMSLYQMDFFTSTQIGLPRIIKDSQCDTRPPAHLFDHDISFENEEIPPEQPLTESSPLLYVIERNAIIKVAAEIYDATEAGPPSSATIATLGAKLDRAVDAIPAWLKHKPLETSLAENPVTILHQMTLDILIHKAVYLLHRRSFVKGSAADESTGSTELCINAALAILEHQRRMSEETEPGGLMFLIRWKVATSLNHEFLQATTMLCFALTRFHEGQVGSCHRRSEILETLNVARGLWEKIADRSTEARRAAKAITAVLQQDRDQSAAATSRASDGFFEQTLPGVAAPSYFDNFDYAQDMTLDPSIFAVDNDLATFENMDRTGPQYDANLFCPEEQ
ncbi:fungal-specific transcription factor domain-containing protein [Diplogelasinospora grovesii]|uniref:Fungal-specific transcription factor domain-containing protein n=1 Tax=Diplogelasinospora grovesii TaxID=303347 RepID=A0AAN6MXW4_9PEZI|nr:fungal-specific transcription factor domain-containing protein [Diplogelasinospora grovesii]